MPIPASTILNNLGPRIQQMLHRPATSGASMFAACFSVITGAAVCMLLQLSAELGDMNCCRLES